MVWDKDGGRRHAEAAIGAYDLPAQVGLELISLSENATYLVSGDEPIGVIRVYRPDYQTETAKRSELVWVEELRSTGTVATPRVLPTADGRTVHHVVVDGEGRDVVMFEYVPGRELGSEDRSTYVLVGSIAAKLHLQASSWAIPADFERMRWDLDEVVGPRARWGDWRQELRLDDDERALLEEAETVVRSRLQQYPLDAANSGLVHGDLRSTNILTDEVGGLWVIDFDDSGFSWFLWDLASMLTFREHLPEAAQTVEAWLEGYLEIRTLRDEDLAVIPDLVFARRLQVLGWLASRSDSDAAREVGDSYARATVGIAQSYLAGTFLH